MFKSAIRFQLLLAVVMFGLFRDAAQAQTLIVVRHADRKDDTDDSPLSPHGFERAARLSKMLTDLHVNQIIWTDKQRTHQTAQPLVVEQKLDKDHARSIPEAAYGGDPKRLATSLTNNIQAKDDVCLLVYHHGLIPDLINALIENNGQPQVKTIDPKTYDDLWILSRMDGKWWMVHLKFGDPPAP